VGDLRADFAYRNAGVHTRLGNRAIHQGHGPDDDVRADLQRAYERAVGADHHVVAEYEDAPFAVQTQKLRIGRRAADEVHARHDGYASLRDEAVATEQYTPRVRDGQAPHPDRAGHQIDAIQHEKPAIERKADRPTHERKSEIEE